MILETKAGLVAGVAIAAGAVAAWASRPLLVALQASGIVIDTGVLVQLVMTAVIVGVAFGVVRNKVDAMTRRFDGFERKLDAVQAKVERFDEKLNHHASEIDRLRALPARRPGREPVSDAEDV